MKEKQCYYIDNNSHNLTIWKSAENNKPNTLKLSKTTIIWQNFKILFNIINKNIDISFRIQIHQNVNLNLINQVVIRYSVDDDDNDILTSISLKAKS